MTAPFPLYTTDLIHLSSPRLIVLLDLAIAWCRVPQYVPGIRLFFFSKQYRSLCNGSIKKRPTVWGYNEYFFF